MRIRTVKPEWLEDQVLADTSDAARMLSIALILMADDYGRGRSSIAEIAMQAWRFEMVREDGAKARETLAKARGALAELAACRFVTLYTVEGQDYFAIRTWDKHQKVDKPGKPRIPEQPRDSENPRETLAKAPETLATDLGPRTTTKDHDLGASEPRARASRALVRAYGQRYERETRSPWIRAPHEQAIDQLAVWLAKTHPNGIDDAAQRLVDGIFAKPGWRQHGWPLRFVVSDGPAVVMGAVTSAEPDSFADVTDDIEARFRKGTT